MAKFENSNYVSLFKDKSSLKTYVDEVAMLRTNFGFWQSQFYVDPVMTETQPDGSAPFRMRSVKKTPAPMMDMRAPLGKGKPLDWEGFMEYVATIPNFIAPSIVEQAFERAYKQKQYEMYGDDAELIKAWTSKVQGQKDSADQTLSNMSAQVISTGKINYNFGRAIKGSVYDAMIPAENIVKCGTESDSLVWTDSACPILDQMAALELKFRQDNGYENIPMKWQITYKMFHDCFLHNTQVKTFIRDYRKNNDIPTTAGFVFDSKMFQEIVKLYEGISPIEVVVESQKDYTGMVSGWKDGVAVLRPAGYAGPVKHTESIDRFMFENFGSSNVNKVFTKVGGVMTLINTTLNNGDFKEWHTDLILDAVPALDEVPYHLIVDTTQAGNGTTTLS